MNESLSTALSVARTYGTALLDVIEAAIGQSLTKLTPSTLLRAVDALSEDHQRALIAAVLKVHEDHAAELLAIVHRGPPDEIAVVDHSTPLHQPTLTKLFLYAEVVICPDPLVEHPFGIVAATGLTRLHHPGSPDGIREEFLQALEFYASFAVVIREGILLPTAWHVVAALKRHIQSSWLGPAEGEAPYDAMPNALKGFAEEHFDVKPAKYDGNVAQLYDFSVLPPSETSQIAVTAKGDPSFVVPNIQTYFGIVGTREEDGKRYVDLAQAPPESEQLFARWVQDSKRKALHNRVTALQSALVLATRVRGAVVTTSETNNQLLRLLTSDIPPTDPPAATAIATMNLPILDGLQPAHIARVRRDVESLQSFRTSFRRACASIKAEVGTDRFQHEVDTIARDTVEQGIRDLDLARRALGHKLSGTTVFSTLMLTLSFTQAWLGLVQWLPAAVATITQAKVILDAIPKQSELKRNPYFMLWKLSRTPFARK